MGKLSLAVALVMATGCLVDVDYGGTRFRCNGDGVCPGGLTCQTDGFCGAGDPPDAGPDDVIRGPGTWVATAPGPLAPRVFVDAVWTGEQFLVIGGSLDNSFTTTDTSALYDPASDTWTEIAPIGIGPRHTVYPVWTGTEAIFWGGGLGASAAGGGARYDPATDAWTALSDAGAPGDRIYHSALWTGNRMLVWGGWDEVSDHLQTGALYNPISDSWTPMATLNAPSPRSFATAIWTGSAAIIWGGCAGPMGACPDVQGTGGVYNPADDSWTPMSSDGAPTARSQSVAVWTGDEMLLFGGATSGNAGDPLNSGFAYNPATDSWRPLSIEAAPEPRADSAAEWIGDEKMLIWGGVAGQGNGFLYDPSDDQWEVIGAGAGAPGPRSRFAHALTGDGRLFIFGGSFTATTGHLWSPEP